MDNINNIQNLDSIIFYTGSESVHAASYVEGRNFGVDVEKYGTLMKGNDGTSYYSNFPSVKYKERNVNVVNINDLYTETLSYVVSNNEELVGNTYIANNRYNVIYTYETDLENDFNNARPYVKDNLKEFLLGLNEQTFNKQLKYDEDFEVYNIKIDQTYFTWYPKDTIAYYNTEITKIPNTYIYYSINDVNRNIADGSEITTLQDQIFEYLSENNMGDQAYNEEYSSEVLTELMNEKKQECINEYLETNGLEELRTNDYIHCYTYVYETIKETQVPYIIGGDYYSYIRQSYATIDSKLEEKIDSNLDIFETKYNNDHSIYAYYMYDCNSDIQMQLTTNSLGVKESTFKIGFDSIFNKWFDNVINIHAVLDANDNIINITSSKNDAIFSVFKNSKDRITGENIELDKDETNQFITNAAVTIEDNINILTPYSIDTLDLSPLKTKIASVVDLTETGWLESGCNIKSLIFDDGDDNTKSNIEKIFGINELPTLEYLNISNIDKFFRTPAIDKLENLKVFKAKNSNIDSFRPHRGNTLYYISLPPTIKSIKLVDNEFVRGTIKVAGIDETYEGVFEYTPNIELNSLTLRHIDDKLSYRLVYDWYNALDNANMLDNVLYLELIGINWQNVKVNDFINLKHFDLCPDFSGEVSLIGIGNYNHITRDEYQNILKAYGINAFVQESNISNKIFKNLNISLAKQCEDFEFKLTVLNKSIKAANEANEGVYGFNAYNDTLNVEFKSYYYDSYGEHTGTLPNTNRAANALLDIIYKDNQDFTFIKDVIEDNNGNDISNYAYCKLDRSIDTSNSNEIRNIKAGDILLFNGDTIMIFFKNVTNTVYEYTKLGSIIDKPIMKGITSISSIEHWFDVNNAATLSFIPSVRPIVIDNITATVSTDEFNSESEQTLTLTVSLPEAVNTAIANNEVEDPEIVVEAPEYMTVVDNENGTYTITINYDYSTDSDAEIKIYAHANREETEVVKTISLIAGEIIEQPTIEPTVIDENTESQITIDDSAIEYNNESGELEITDALHPEFDESTHTLTID